MSENRKTRGIFISERDMNLKTSFPTKRSTVSYKSRPKESELALEHFDFELVDERFLWDTHDNHYSAEKPIHLDSAPLFLHSEPMPPSEMSELTTSSESHPNSADEGENENEIPSDIMAVVPDWIKSDHDNDENLPEIDDLDPDLIHSLSDIEPTSMDAPIPSKKRGGWLKLISTLLPIICAVLLIQMPDSTLDILLTTLERHSFFPSSQHDMHPITPQRLTETMCLVPASHTFSYMFVSECFPGECEVIVVAKDLHGNPRTSGGDTFTAIEISPNKNQHNVTLSVYDIQNGRYLVSVPRSNQVVASMIQVSLTDTMKEISNSPLVVTWPVDKTDTSIKDEVGVETTLISETDHLLPVYQEDTSTLPDTNSIPIPSELNVEMQESSTDSSLHQDEAQLADFTNMVGDIPEQVLDTFVPEENVELDDQYLLEEQTFELPQTVIEQPVLEVNQLKLKDTCPIYSLNCHLRQSNIEVSLKNAYQNVLGIRTHIRNSILMVLGQFGEVFNIYLKPMETPISQVVEARRTVRETIFNGISKIDKYTMNVRRVAVNWRQQTRKSFSIIGDRIRRIFRRV